VIAFAQFVFDLVLEFFDRRFLFVALQTQLLLSHHAVDLKLLRQFIEVVCLLLQQWQVELVDHLVEDSGLAFDHFHLERVQGLHVRFVSQQCRELRVLAHNQFNEFHPQLVINMFVPYQLREQHFDKYILETDQLVRLE